MSQSGLAVLCGVTRQAIIGVDGEIQKYAHYYPDGRVVQANIYPDKWLELFRTWFNSVWKREQLLKYLSNRDPESLPSVSKLLGLLEPGED